MHKIAVLIPYFGAWPAWINFFVESCRANSSIDWILFTDQDRPQNHATNIRYVQTSFEEYRARLAESLGTEINVEAPYKLCDFKPALAFVHSKLLRAYDFVGFGDLDIIYGDIRAFYDEDLLSQYDMLSSHADRVSGHFCLMRNREDVVTAFKRSRRWKRAFADPVYQDFDEREFFNLFAGRKAKLVSRLGVKPFRCLFREAYSTPAATMHMRWFWKDGRLTNEYYPHHPLMYLHFMSWHSNRWHSSQEHVQSGSSAPWSRLDRIVKMDWRDARDKGFMISPDGIEAIRLRPYR
jgi:hypothetical protein